jgi:hypothetical protein
MTTAMSEALDNLDLLEETYRSIADIPPPPLPERPKLVSKNNSPVTVNPQLEIIAEGMKRAEQLFASKNSEYGDAGDILGNFRRLAQQQGVPMSTAWMFLAGKHLDSIQQYVIDARNNTSRHRTQPLSERIDDLVVYGLLLLVIAAEEGA